MNEFFYPYHPTAECKYSQIRALPVGSHRSLEGRLVLDFIASPFMAMTLAKAYNASRREVAHA